MATSQPALLTFNRGIVSPQALGRVDLSRVRLSAETQTNWMPRAMGGMSIRPGFGYVAPTYGNAKAQYIDFVFALDDAALIEVTDGQVRVLVDDAIVERPEVSTAVANGTFGSDLASWTDADESGATSAWATGGYMSLIGTKYNAAIRRQTLTVAGADIGVEHALRIVVERGPVLFRAGSASAGEQFIAETTLGTGTHSLTLTPTGDIYLQFSNRNQRAALVDSIAVEGVGEMVLPAPWTVDDLPLLRWDQTNDVIFVACEGYQGRRIERRSVRSWSIVLYEPLDGPFRLVNTSKIRITPSAVTGDVTLTASAAFFRSTHVGALFRLSSVGQYVEADLSAENTFTNAIKVVGVGTRNRTFDYVIAGTWTGTVTIQQSVGEEGNWTDTGLSFTSNTTGTFDTDNNDNVIIYYRIGIKAGDYGSGTAELSLSRSAGSITGIARINAVASSTSATAGVIKELGSTSASEVWYEGSWSDYRGWPSAVTFYEGRLGWFGKSGAWLSISDTVDSFDPLEEGDAAAISRSIRYGSADAVSWAQAAQRLLVGTASAELSLRSTSFDEAMTNKNYNVKPASTQGTKRDVAAVLMDGSVVFVQASGVRVYELALGGQGGLDYTATDLTTLAPEIGEPEIVAMAVQRQPDTRIHCVRSDGKAVVAVIDKLENVLAWVLVETDGFIEGVAKLPGSLEDRIYYVVRRTINGSTVRYLEKWALESECRPGAVVRIADSHRVYSGVGGSILGGLTHLEGETVICWADSVYLGEFTVSSGQIDVVATVDEAIVGLSYVADYMSNKMSSVFKDGSTSLSWRKSYRQLSMVVRNTHRDGLKYGTDADHLSPLPGVEEGRTVPDDYIWTDHEFDFAPVESEWKTDSRIYLRATAPYPVTVLALAPILDANQP